MTRSRGGAAAALLLALGILQGASIEPAIAQPVPPLAANDVSWLFPAPKEAADLANLISVGDLTAPDPTNPGQSTPIWSQATFEEFVKIAESSSQVVGTTFSIGLPDAAKKMDAWHVAAVRLDSGAPGHSADIKTQFGQIPQIRLILQPVTREGGAPVVHDIAAHLTFNFTLPLEVGADNACKFRQVPDMPALKAIVDDLAAMRAALARGEFGNAPPTDDAKVDTAKAALGVHPGLASPVTAKGVRNAMEALLERHLANRPPSAMAIMGLPDGKPEPWIFVAMIVKSNGAVAPVTGPTLDGTQVAQTLSFASDFEGEVIPTPSNNNRKAITCQHAALPPPLHPAGRHGSSTAELFGGSTLPEPEIREILDLIADPKRSHFFNTDCVSCHTETRRDMALLEIKDVPGIDPAVLPQEDWNVRNFGWFPSFLRKVLEPTVTRRTANETQEVLNFINTNLLN